MVVAERGGFGGLLQDGWAMLGLSLPAATFFLAPQRIKVLEEATGTVLLGFVLGMLRALGGAEEGRVIWAGGTAQQGQVRWLVW